MEAYIIKAYRSAVGKSKKGMFRNKRPDDLGADVIQHLMNDTPEITSELLDDVIVGSAMPEAEQGLNMGRMISLMGLATVKVPGMTVNRYCASGLESIAIAVAKIKAGMARCILAGGVESMSAIPMGGWRVVPNPKVAREHPDWYWNMGITAENVVKKYNVSRLDQDKFALQSHQRAAEAIKKGYFASQIVTLKSIHSFISSTNELVEEEIICETDEGVRYDTNMGSLSGLKPVFAQRGSVTAGNSSQTSDGAAFTLVVSEQFVKDHNLSPIARFVDYAAAGVEPALMGIGPVAAVPKVLKSSGMKLNEMDIIELNEAFAGQALAVIRELDLDMEKTNVNGGAVALGHPLGCTGTKLTVQLIHELKRRNEKYGMVTMCVGSGQGAAGIFEVL